MAVKLFAHCETVLPTANAYVLDLGPDHPPSPAGFLRLLTDTRLRQLKLIDPARWGSEIIVRRCHSPMVSLVVSTERAQPHACELSPAQIRL